jgi:hypothetical protein
MSQSRIVSEEKAFKKLMKAIADVLATEKKSVRRERRSWNQFRSRQADHFEFLRIVACKTNFKPVRVDLAEDKPLGVMGDRTDVFDVEPMVGRSLKRLSG